MRTIEEIRNDIRSAMALRNDRALLSLAEEIAAHGTHVARGLSLQARAASFVFQGDMAAAQGHLESALGVYEAVKDQRGVADVVGNLANVLSATGRIELALEYYRRALALHADLGRKHEVAVVTGNIAGLLSSMGDHGQALEYYGRSLSMHEDLGDQIDTARVAQNMGLLYRRIGDYPTSLALYDRAQAVYSDLGHQSGIADVLQGIGDIHQSMGDMPRALQYYQQAMEMHTEQGDMAQSATLYENMGVLFATTGDQAQALLFLRKALELKRQIDDEVGVSRLTGSVITSLIETGSIDEAESLLDVQDLMTTAVPTVRAAYYANRASLCERTGDLNASRGHLLRALELVSSSGERAETAMYHKRLREIAHQQNDLAEYVNHNSEYVRITEEIRGQESTRKIALLEAEKRVAAERFETERHRALLYNTLPAPIAERVLRGEVVNDSIEDVTVMFMDMVGFTTMTSSMTPGSVVDLLSEIFTACDVIMAEHGMMKVKTIGDCYMAAAFSDNGSHWLTTDPRKTSVPALRAAHAAMAVLRALAARHSEIRVRIGLHCGPVTAGVIGTERLQYDIWGDTVNVASRMESHGEPGRIHASQAIADALAHCLPDSLTLRKRGVIDVKGKGQMTTYWLS